MNSEEIYKAIAQVNIREEATPPLDELLQNIEDCSSLAKIAQAKGKHADIQRHVLKVAALSVQWLEASSLPPAPIVSKSVSDPIIPIENSTSKIVSAPANI